MSSAIREILDTLLYKFDNDPHNDKATDQALAAIAAEVERAYERGYRDSAKDDEAGRKIMLKTMDDFDRRRASEQGADNE